MVNEDWKASDSRWDPSLIMTLALGMTIAVFLATVH